MSITETSPDALREGFAAFLRRESVGFEDIRLGLTHDGKIDVCCYTRWMYRESVTEDEARTAFAEARESISRLLALSSDFQREFASRPVHYLFCQDTGKAAVVRYKLDGERLVGF